jgi:alcohol dehydrogenase YqhD (iron-dependent ADH family)
LQGVVEILIVVGGVGIVDSTQFVDAEVWVRGHSVGDLGAESQVEKNGTIVIWKC